MSMHAGSEAEPDVAVLSAAVVAHEEATAFLVREVAVALSSISALVQKHADNVSALRPEPENAQSRLMVGHLFLLRVAVHDLLAGAGDVAQGNLRSYEQELALFQETGNRALLPLLRRGKHSFQAILRATDGLKLAQKSIVNMVDSYDSPAAPCKREASKW